MDSRKTENSKGSESCRSRSVKARNAFEGCVPHIYKVSLANKAIGVDWLRNEYCSATILASFMLELIDHQAKTQPRTTG